MKTIITSIGFLFFTLHLSATEIILAYGQNSGNNFNGWYVSPYQTDAVEFDEHSIQFFAENGGEMNIEIYKKVTDLEAFENMQVLFNFEERQNCVLHSVQYAVSSNGRDWINLKNSHNNTNCIINEDIENIHFIKAVANVQFFKNGTLVCDYAKLEGDKKALEIIPIEADEVIEFNLFNYNKMLNVETQSEQQYEVLITAMSGKIMFRESFVGSNRINLDDFNTGFYIVNIIQGNEFKLSKKIVC